MKCYVLILLIVILKTEFVQSLGDDDPPTKGRTQSNEFTPYIPKRVPTETYNCPNSRHKVAIIAMGVTIGVLLCIIIGLLVFILKQTVIPKSVDDEIEINKNESSQKYVKQVSSEPSIVVSYTRENSNGNDEGKFKLQRQDSKLAVVEYPKSFNTNEIKIEQPTSSTVTLSKIMQQHPVQISRDRMKELCKGVLLKSQQLNVSTTSLTNLEKMKEESKAKQLANHAVVDKSASTGLLDVVEDSKASPSPISVKKIKVFPDHTQKPIKLPVFIPKVNKKATDVLIKDDFYDNLPKSKRTGESVGSYNENADDVYDNPPKLTRPVSNRNDEDMDEVYDNPPNRNRPVSSYGDDVYDNLPNNRPLLSDASANTHLDDIYDNPQSNEPVFVSSKERILKAGQLNGDEYVFPQKKSRGILLTDGDSTGYVSPLTNAEELCFNSDYTNAKTLHAKNPFH